MAQKTSRPPKLKLSSGMRSAGRRNIVKSYHCLMQVLGDEGFTQTILIVMVTASIFALLFDAPVEIVVGIIVVGAITALIEHRIWTSKHGRK